MVGPDLVAVIVALGSGVILALQTAPEMQAVADTLTRQQTGAREGGWVSGSMVGTVLMFRLRRISTGTNREMLGRKRSVSKCSRSLTTQMERCAETLSTAMTSGTPLTSAQLSSSGGTMPSWAFIPTVKRANNSSGSKGLPRRRSGHGSGPK